jgi:hypothetical protein
MTAFETQLSGKRGIVLGNGWGREIICATAIVAMTTAMLDNANDDVGLFAVPAGAVVVGATLSATDMDTNGTPTLAIDIGDSADEDRIFAASVVGQAGTLSQAMARTAHLYKYTAETQLRAYIQTAAATAAAGTLTFSLFYFIDPEFSTTALVAA